ncbi:MAG: hypothetical protein GYA24_23115 [Candidatus Lokiarchaeota archaeon]|nr:hypothetical protein [Candidatus Lokiarchaeota archaeon]
MRPRDQPRRSVKGITEALSIPREPDMPMPRRHVTWVSSIRWTGGMLDIIEKAVVTKNHAECKAAWRMDREQEGPVRGSGRPGTGNGQATRRPT